MHVKIAGKRANDNAPNTQRGESTPNIGGNLSVQAEFTSLGKVEQGGPRRAFEPPQCSVRHP
ncbi:MAG TPA: hypothetical protein VGN07_07700 [Steroidobacteraceae bacterium]